MHETFTPKGGLGLPSAALSPGRPHLAGSQYLSRLLSTYSVPDSLLCVRIPGLSVFLFPDLSCQELSNLAQAFSLWGKLRHCEAIKSPRKGLTAQTSHHHPVVV